MSTPDTLAVPSVDVASSPTLASLASLDRLLEHVDRLAESLAEHMPGARTRRGFRGGCWVASLFAGGGLENRSAYTRFDVEILLSHGGTEVELTLRKTVRDHDLAPSQFATTLDDAGWVAAEAFLETEFLAFAERWFERR